MSRGAVAWAVLVVSAALAACGGDGGGDADDPRQPGPVVQDEQKRVLETIDALRTASRSGDAQRICDELFTEALASSVQEAAGRSCADEVDEQFVDPNAEISVARAIQITGNRATATIRESNEAQSRLQLVKDGDRWRINGVTPANAG